jgi:thiamine biosynthesis lipoprotein
VSAIAPTRTASDAFACFGGSCALYVAGSGSAGTPQQAVAAVRRRLLAWHAQFSRFIAASELSRLNADPADTVAVSPMMAALVQAALDAAWLSGGLVDPTLLDEVERAGYDGDLDGPGSDLRAALAAAPARRPAGPDPEQRWRSIHLDPRRRTVTRPAGVRIDSGGIAKGLFADVLASALAGHDEFVIDCSGDLRVGGRARNQRPIGVASPFDDGVVHTFELRAGAIATSGIGRRSWLDASGRPAHHLIDPATGRPVFTGVVQATALAPDAVTAEMLAKAAVLAGPEQLVAQLPHGGLAVLDDGSTVLVEAA